MPDESEATEGPVGEDAGPEAAKRPKLSEGAVCSVMFAAFGALMLVRVLVLGLRGAWWLALAVGGLFGLVGLLLGLLAHRRVRRNAGALRGRGVAVVGICLAALDVLLAAALTIMIALRAGN